MISKIRRSILNFSQSSNPNSVLCGLAIGLYPLLYYYDQNFTLINSWSQLGMFLLSFILMPISVCFLIQKVENLSTAIKIPKFIMSVFNIVYFSILLITCTLGIKLKIIAIGISIATLFGILLYKHLNKIIVFQLLLAIVALPKSAVSVIAHLNSDMTWKEQPDNIVNSKFVEKPNIYILQPDGYPNFSELKRGNYNFDNTVFEDFLTNQGFKLYNDFRSNYPSTLSSNSSMFTMKHHYYNNPKPGDNEVYNSRDIIVGDNAVVQTFKNNGYKTNLILENSYLLVNRPKLGYDYCNIPMSKVSFLARGFEVHKNVIEDLNSCIDNSTGLNFYFIETMKPGHIYTFQNKSKGKEIERENYYKSLQEANTWLSKVIAILEEKDPNALVVIVADHGGFVGFDYTLQSKIKQTDPELIKSIFTAALAIKWPNGKAPEYDDHLKTNVNLFRSLIAYLSKDYSLLENLQPDKSYTVIEKGAPFGVYEYLDEDEKVVFKKQPASN